MARSSDDIRELIALRIEMEDGVVPVGNVLPISARDEGDQPRVLACRTAAGMLVFCREDVPASARERITSLRGRAFADEDAVRQILGAALVREVRRVRWYTMEMEPGNTICPDVKSTPGGFVIVVDGRVVSRAWTTQESERAVEVEVETDPEYRGRGYATQVVAAWAGWARGAGKIPFYSHLLTNDASAGVARSLGLTFLSDEVEYL